MLVMIIGGGSRRIIVSKNPFGGIQQLTEIQSIGNLNHLINQPEVGYVVSQVLEAIVQLKYASIRLGIDRLIFVGDEVTSVSLVAIV